MDIKTDLWFHLPRAHKCVGHSGVGLSFIQRKPSKKTAKKSNDHSITKEIICRMKLTAHIFRLTAKVKFAALIMYHLLRAALFPYLITQKTTLVL